MVNIIDAHIGAAKGVSSMGSNKYPSTECYELVIKGAYSPGTLNDSLNTIVYVRYVGRTTRTIVCENSSTKIPETVSKHP
jgi:hypothetical protein